MQTSSPVVSVVLSFRNEADTLATLIARLETMFAAEPVSYELLFVNDASTDDSLGILLRARERNPRVKILNMSRRFGVAECVRAGMAAATGDAVIYMDTDLQDPPEVIPALLARWREGADIVNTIRTRRHGESLFKMRATRLAYRLIHLGSTIELPIDAGDFKLLSRAAVGHLLSLRESDPYLRGLVIWLGFTQTFVPYERDARHGGRTHFPFFSRNPWKTFVVGLTSFSFLPVYACLALGTAGLVVTALVAGAWLLQRDGGAGRLGLIAVMTLFWSTTMAALGGLGIYLVRIYKDVRGRPQYIVASTVGLDGSEGEDSRE